MKRHAKYVVEKLVLCILFVSMLLYISACSKMEEDEQNEINLTCESKEIGVIEDKTELLIQESTENEKTERDVETEPAGMPEVIDDMKTELERVDDKPSIKGIFTISEREYVYKESGFNIDLIYPELHGFEDKQKEKQINSLIEEEIKRQVPDKLGFPEEWIEDGYSRYVHMDYEIKFLNSDIVSILYRGCDGGMTPDHGPDPTAMATTIDLETAEVVALTDIVTDMEELCTLLLEDQFENISIWDGMPSDKRISNEYPDSQGRETLLEALYGTHEYEVIEWYTGGDNLVIVTTDYYYEEYSAGIDFYPGLVDENFREKLRAED